MSEMVAILCSGQGEQHPAMFDLVANCPEADIVFAAASDVLGQDPRRFVSDAASAELFSNRSGQILCCTQALAAWAALGSARPARAVFAGYSIGELAAWGCAGLIDARSTLRLARDRAALMDAAAPSDGTLAAIVGLRRAFLEPILAQHALSIAIVRDVDSFVVGGCRAGLRMACEEAASRGATRAVMLPVAVPSHTHLLREATDPFRVRLRAASRRLSPVAYRLLSGIDGAAVNDIETGIDKLARQISTTIDWMACLESCRSAGAVAALELGPGMALSRMAAPLFPDGHARALEEFRTLAGLRAWLFRMMG